MKAVTINQLGDSFASGEVYFIKTGKRLENGVIQANSSKINVTKQFKKLVLDGLFRVKDGKCIFCNRESTLTQNISHPKKSITIDIETCDKCEIE